MDPQQELFTKLLIELKKVYPAQVYDSVLPPEATPYPFIYIGDNQLIDDNSIKNAEFGNVYQTIKICHNNPRERGVVSSMLQTIKDTAKKAKYTDSFVWYIKNIDQRIMPDTTTSTPLLQGVLELEFKFTRR